MKIKWKCLSLFLLNHNFIVLCELLMPCQIFAQKCSNCQEINQNIKTLGVSSNTLNTVPFVIYIGIFCYWVLLHYNCCTCHSKQLPVGLMVLFDGMVHFLKIDIIIKKNYQNYIVALIWQPCSVFCESSADLRVDDNRYVEFSTCQVSMLWHNSLPSLWTFQLVKRLRKVKSMKTASALNGIKLIK